MKKLNTAIFSLHKYWIRANLMRMHFYQELDRVQAEHDGPDVNFTDEFDLRAYMDYWYSAVYVVIEGYKKLKLDDGGIDELLTSHNVYRLQLYRHGTYHLS
jgi:hypothetical protein